MSTNIINTVAFLRTSRVFPEDSQQLSVELTKAYIDIANVVNARTIGIFPSNRPIVNGEYWYTGSANQSQQALRRVYPFTSAGSIPHSINTTQIGGFIRIWGTFTDGTNWYHLPYVDVTAANNQVSLSVTPTNIVITAGGGSPPTITKGAVVLEWLSI